MQVAILAGLLWAGPPVYDVEGQLSRKVGAVATLHGTESPFTASTYVGPDRKFVFRKIQPGTYTLSILLVRRGEIRRTIDVGPSTADEDGRLRLNISIESSTIHPDRGALVTARELSAPRSAISAYAAAEKRLSKRDVTKRDIEGAIRQLERAVEIAPQFAAAWNFLGTIAFQTGRIEDAERYFRRAIEEDPLIWEPVVNLGGALLASGKLFEALDYNRQAVERKPDDALGQSQLGMTYLRLGYLVEAEQHLLTAAKIDPGHFSNPQISLAELYLRRNQRFLAAEQLSHLLRNHPDWPDAAKVRESIRRLRR